MVPLLLAATGGLLSERSDVINIALEGMMISGAFGSIAGSRAFGSPLPGSAVCAHDDRSGRFFGRSRPPAALGVPLDTNRQEREHLEVS